MRRGARWERRSTGVGQEERGPTRRRAGPARERGSASVEQAGLAALIALLLLAAIAAVAAGGKIDAGRALAGAIAKKIACAPRLPDACRHHPLVPAYGWPLARLARALAPAAAGPARPLRPAPRPGRLPPLPPRELRGRRRASPDGVGPPHHRLHPARSTGAPRSAGSRSPTGSTARPSAGRRSSRRATQTQVEAASGTRVLLKDDPALVPLETLPGRDHYDFPPDRAPPWQWHVHGLYPGWSS